ncbi:MAG: hypothetical protein HPY45_02600 [Anaerolineae bacterium]|nr:hypothetical protein [Anaerolineae bacterium]
MRGIPATFVAVLTAVMILLGYFVSLPALESARTLLLGWAVTLVSVAAIVGVFNLVAVHWRKLFIPGRERDVYSAFFLLAFFVTLVVGLWLSPSDAQYQHIVTSIQAPVEISLMAVVAVSLAYGVLRMLQRRRDLMTILFVLSVLFFLILESGILAPLAYNPLLKQILHLVNRIPLAGARGILLGIALGSLTTGLRVLFGSDRPYRG